MTRQRGAAPGPQLRVVDGETVMETRSGRALKLIEPPDGMDFDADQQRIWDKYIADNPYLDELDGALAAMFCVEYARYQKDPRGLTASEKSQLMKMFNDLYLTAAERNRKNMVETGPARGGGSRFLSKRKSD